MTTANWRGILVAVKDAGAVELLANAATASGTNTAIGSATKRTIGAPRRTTSLTLLNGYVPVGHREIQRARCSSAQDSSLEALPRLTEPKAPSPSTEARKAFLRALFIRSDSGVSFRGIGFPFGRIEVPKLAIFGTGSRCGTTL
ncbi:hypothetical protein, partial [Rathayibacter tritici]|uniref:hypothetical protein n=1 Tax=Rathayibacter tritici TaxID=33888 RepID=UPI001CA4C092